MSREIVTGTELVKSPRGGGDQDHRIEQSESAVDLR
jgi:hypothetical protein